MSTVEALESAAGNTHLNVWNPAFPLAGSTSVSVEDLCTETHVDSQSTDGATRLNTSFSTCNRYV